jgi:hypothetical protein
MYRSVLILTLALLACERPGPCFGLGLGERYQVELLEAYTEGSSYELDLGRPVPASCGPGFDLQPADLLSVRVVEQPQGDPCDVNVVELESPVRDDLGPASQRQFSLLQGPASGIFQVYHAATLAGCEGTWGLAVKSQGPAGGADGDPFPRPEPGGVPPILLVRGFRAEELTPECLALLPEGTPTCMDHFVAVITRL